MTEKEQYKFQGVDIEEVPAPDDLLSGIYGLHEVSAIEVTVGGKYERGMVMMRGADGFEKATREGVKTAPELCILGSSFELEDGLYCETYGYFGGEYTGERVILPYETDGDNHAELMKEIVPELRRQKIYIRG